MLSLEGEKLEDHQSRRIGRQVLRFPVLDSTMDTARGLARGGAAEGTVVWAEEQRAGRGRRGRAWLSPRGGLTLSIILRPPASRLPSLTMIASVAVVRVLRRLAGLEARVKWPNDVLLAGKKVAGILVETSFTGEKLDYAILGIGLNVNLDPRAFPEIAATATSLSQQLGRELEVQAVLDALLEELDRLYSGGQVFEEWRSLLDTLGKRVTVTGEGKDEEGVAWGVTPEGSLLLRRDSGEVVEIVAGEVSLRR